MAAKRDIMKHTSKGVPKHSSQVQEIPPYSLPNWRAMLGETWIRSSDVLTIVTPQLLALLMIFQALGVALLFSALVRLVMGLVHP